MKKKNNLINLEPIKFFEVKNYNKKLLINGYLIRISKIVNIDKKFMIVINNQIFKALSLKKRKKIKPNILVIY